MINFHISSEKIGNLQLVELLNLLSISFKMIDLPFFVIGATARDIVLRHFAGIASLRKTEDLDIAIAIPNWEKYDEVSTMLQNAGLVKDKNQKQRFFFENYKLDIVPFGGVEKEDEKIYWLPDEDVAISVKGFKEVLQDAVTVNIDERFEIKIASLHALFILKLNAWIDRRFSTDKDAEDICFILENYFDVCIKRKNLSDKYGKQFEREDFNMFLVGGIWLAYDLCPLLNREQLEYYANVLMSEVNKQESSLLINQMHEQSPSLSYELLSKTISEIAKIFYEPD